MSTKYTDAKIRRMIHLYHIEENLENDKNPKKNENYKDWAYSYSYSILEDYIPDGPGWVGDVLTVIYGDLDTVQNFMIEDGRLIRIVTAYEK